jgi:hypothetical protein
MITDTFMAIIHWVSTVTRFDSRIKIQHKPNICDDVMREKASIVHSALPFACLLEANRVRIKPKGTIERAAMKGTTATWNRGTNCSTNAEESK